MPTRDEIAAILQGRMPSSQEEQDWGLAPNSFTSPTGNERSYGAFDLTGQSSNYPGGEGTAPSYLTLPGTGFGPYEPPTFNERWFGDGTGGAGTPTYVPRPGGNLSSDEEQRLGIAPNSWNNMDEFGGASRQIPSRNPYSPSGNFGPLRDETGIETPWPEGGYPSTDPRGAFERGGGIAGALGGIANDVQQGWRALTSDEERREGFAPNTVGYDPNRGYIPLLSGGVPMTGGDWNPQGTQTVQDTGYDREHFPSMGEAQNVQPDLFRPVRSGFGGSEVQSGFDGTDVQSSSPSGGWRMLTSDEELREGFAPNTVGYDQQRGYFTLNPSQGPMPPLEDWRTNAAPMTDGGWRPPSSDEEQRAGVAPNAWMGGAASGIPQLDSSVFSGGGGLRALTSDEELREGFAPNTVLYDPNRGYIPYHEYQGPMPPLEDWRTNAAPMTDGGWQPPSSDAEQQQGLSPNAWMGGAATSALTLPEYGAAGWRPLSSQEEAEFGRAPGTLAYSPTRGYYEISDQIEHPSSVYDYPDFGRFDTGSTLASSYRALEAVNQNSRNIEQNALNQTYNIPSGWSMSGTGNLIPQTGGSFFGAPSGGTNIFFQPGVGASYSWA